MRYFRRTTCDPMVFTRYMFSYGRLKIVGVTLLQTVKFFRRYRGIYISIVPVTVLLLVMPFFSLQCLEQILCLGLANKKANVIIEIQLDTFFVQGLKVQYKRNRNVILDLGIAVGIQWHNIYVSNIKAKVFFFKPSVVVCQWIYHVFTSFSLINPTKRIIRFYTNIGWMKCLPYQNFKIKDMLIFYWSFEGCRNQV